MLLGQGTGQAGRHQRYQDSRSCFIATITSTVADCSSTLGSTSCAGQTGAASASAGNSMEFIFVLCLSFPQLFARPIQILFILTLIVLVRQ